MKLLAIIIFLLSFAFAAQYFKKYFKAFLLAAIFIVFGVYYIFTTSIYQPDNFKPMKKIQMCHILGNYYNLVVDSFKNRRLDIDAKRDYSVLKTADVYKNFPSYLNKDRNLLQWVLDLSYYKEKFYFYFGITPALIFYLPFNLLTGYYLTDKMLVLFLSAGIFLLSLLIVKMILNEINVKIAPFTSILFVFLIGFSNGVFFLLIRPSSYETSIACAAFMFLIAVFLFAKYLFTSKRSFILLIFTGLALALSVGSRPFYVFVIPLFFAVLIYDSRSKNISIKEITKRALFFAVPCALYGTVLAAYNYLRFDSIFEFGMSYQLNDMNFNEWSFSIKDLTAGLKHYLFRLPLITDSFPFISLNDSFYHKVAKELSMGIIFLFPMVFFFGLLPKFIKDTGVKKEAGVLLCLLSLVFVMNLIVLSIFGMTHRYIFEIMYISAIICNILFAYFYAKTTENKNRRLLGVLLCAIFFITIYVNVSTVISPHIVKHTIYVDEANHQKIRNFLL